MRRMLALVMLNILMLSGVVRANDSVTLAALRADLDSGSLRALLDRQAIVSVPDSLIRKWLADTRFSAFEVTGFNENDTRFAARVRLHLSADGLRGSAGAITFIRVAGIPGKKYRVDQFYDYASGLDLASLIDQKAWLTSTSGEAFMSMLSENPESARLPELAQGREAALALWLAQCAGHACEAAAIQAQQQGDQPALWQLQQAFSVGEREALFAALKDLRNALGEDPWLWTIAGIAAGQNERCDWIVADLQQAWAAHPQSIALADTTLQCTLATLPGDGVPDEAGTRFLNQLSKQSGSETLSRAINTYYRHHDSPRPMALSPWLGAR